MMAVDKWGVAVLAVMMLAMFRQMLPWMGLMCAVLTVIQIERIIHSAYVLTPHDTLHIAKGRFIPTRVVNLTDIRTASVRGRNVELELLTGKRAFLHPLQPEEFCKALNKRLAASLADEE